MRSDTRSSSFCSNASTRSVKPPMAASIRDAEFSINCIKPSKVADDDFNPFIDSMSRSDAFGDVSDARRFGSSAFSSSRPVGNGSVGGGGTMARVDATSGRGRDGGARASNNSLRESAAPSPPLARTRSRSMEHDEGEGESRAEGAQLSRNGGGVTTPREHMKR